MGQSSIPRAPVQPFALQSLPASPGSNGDVRPRPAYRLVESLLVNIPEMLKGRDHWVLWRHEKDKKGKWTKVPYQAHAPGRKASTTDPQTWNPFEDAVRAYRKALGTTEEAAGIGFVFAHDGGLVGFDLDNVIEDGVLDPWAGEILDRLGPTYCEVSPSGCGIKGIVRGELPAAVKRSGLGPDGWFGFEMYDAARFFTITGDIYDETWAEIEDRSEAVLALYERFKTRPSETNGDTPHGPPPAGDDELIDRARKTKDPRLGKFSALFDQGDLASIKGDWSRADFHLCHILAFWFNRDTEAVERVFRRSVLMRDKWDERRGDTTYGKRTIAKAIAAQTEVYAPKSREAKPKGADPRVVIDLDGPVPDPYRLALLYYRERGMRDGERALIYSQAAFWRWHEGSYGPVGIHELKAEIVEVLKVEFDIANIQAAATCEPGKKPPVYRVTGRLVNDVVLCLGSIAHHPDRSPCPGWIDDKLDLPKASEILPTRDWLIHLPSFAKDGGGMIPATPHFFGTWCTDYRFDSEADNPVEWYKFLGSLWPGDIESIETLQEWFGYCLLHDTRLQKILFLIGPKRSGKGTIARVLKGLIGVDNVAAPTLAGLSTNFGLSPLIGKPLAIIGDARLSGRSDTAHVVERLLSISGEDAQTIDRKNLPAWTGQLTTRFVLISNELPRLPDSSGALASRMVLLRLTKTFYDHEDPDLTEKLLAERPGILLWAIEGWKRLRARGKFIQPANGRDLIETMEDLASPVGAFIRECCELCGPECSDKCLEHEVKRKDLFQAWKQWCEQTNRKHEGTDEDFGRDLRAVLPQLGTVNRRTANDRRERSYTGIRLLDSNGSF